MVNNERKRLARVLEEQGYNIDIDRWPARATYYKPSGEALPNLPSDPWSMERYLKRGFTLTPPVKTEAGPETVEKPEPEEVIITEDALKEEPPVKEKPAKKPESKKSTKSKPKKGGKK